MSHYFFEKIEQVENDGSFLRSNKKWIALFET